VTWTAANGNGNTITAYVVRETTGSQVGDSVATDGSATTATVTGLAGGTAAAFSVAAESACGTGPAATTGAVTPTGATSTYAGTILAGKPSVFYRLADPSGPVMADSSGNASDGSYSGQETLGEPAPLASDPAPSAGYNQCCSGIGQGTPALPQADSARSVEAWVESTNGNCCQSLVTWGSPDTDEAFVVGLGSTYVSVDGWGDFLQFITPRPIDDGSWHLLDVTFDGATVIVYLDGQEIGSSPFAGTLNTLGSTLWLANAPFGGYNQYSGNLADVAVYPAALTATQVAGHFQTSGYSRPTAAKVVHAAYGGPNGADISWAYATAKGTPVTAYLVTAIGARGASESVSAAGDATAAQLTGLAPGAYTFSVKASDAYGDGPVVKSGSLTVTGSPTTYASRVLAAKPSVFYRLADGATAAMADSSGHGATGSYFASNVTLGQPPALASDPARSIAVNNNSIAGEAFPTRVPLYDSPRTMEAWVQTTSNAEQYLAGYGSSSTGEGFALGIQAGNQAHTVYVDTYNGTLAWMSPANLDDGAWHMVAVSTDGTSATAYVDGRALGVQQFSGSLNTQLDSGGLTVGAAPWNCCQGPRGGEADVAVFPAALSAAQIQAQFAASGYSVPGAPGSVSATGGINEATVGWTASPAGDPAVTAYLVTALVGGTQAANSVSVPASATTATVTGLAGGTPYGFEVQGVDEYGVGAAATASGTVTPTGTATTYASTVLADKPSVFYRLADGAAAAMADSSGHGATGSYFASNVTLGQPAALGSDPAPSVGVNGNVAAQSFPTDLPLYDSPRTMEGWINTTSNAEQYVAGYGPASTSNAFALGVQAYNQTNEVFVDGYNDTLFFISPVSLDDGSWHMVAVSTNGSNATVYVDGRSLGTQQFASTLDTHFDANGLEVGATSWSCCQAPRGDEADVAVFPKVLSAAQVQAQFAASGYATPGAPTSVSASAGANQATVTWTASPTSDPAVTAYVVTALAGGTQPANSVSVPASATTATVSGLAGGTSYGFKVQAVNEYGVGAAATTASPVSPTGSATTYSSTVLGANPSVFYRLADGATAAMADSSGHGVTGSYFAPNVTLGQPPALASDPAASIAVRGNTAAQSFPSGLPYYSSARTLEAWVNTTSGGYGDVAGYGYPSTGQGFAVGVLTNGEGNVIYADGYNDNIAFNSPTVVNDGNWHLIALTTNGTSATAYVDGKSIGTRKFPQPLDTVPTTSGFVVGSAPWGNDFNGDEADVAVFPAALSAAQIQAQFAASGYSVPGAPGSVSASAGANQATVTWTPSPTSEPAVTAYVVTALAGGTQPANSVSVPATATAATVTGLAGGTSYGFEVQGVDEYGVGAAATTASPVSPTGSATTYASTVLADRPSVFYRLADGAAAAMADSSGHGVTGSYFASNVTLGQPGPLASDPATSVAVNGNTAGQSFPSNLPLYSSPRTLEAWVKTTDGNFIDLAGWGANSTSQGFAMAIQGNVVTLDGYADNLAFSSPTNIDDGNWHFVAITTNGTTGTAYLDGNSLGTATFAQPLDTLPTAAGLTVGAATWGNALNGDEADMAVFPSVLTAAQIEAQYQGSGNGPRAGGVAPPPSGTSRGGHL
jgi:hypothetical protein